MKAICPSALICFVWATFAPLTASADSQADFALPSWKSEHAGRPYFPGGGLWPVETLPKEPVAVARQELKPAPDSSSTDSEPASKKKEYVILKKEIVTPVAVASIREIQDDLPPLGPELYQKYFASRSSQFLIDPQNLMTEQKANDILRLLEFHARESNLDIYAMVFGRNQNVPATHDWNQLHQNWYAGEDSILLVYQLQKPDTLQLHFNPSIASKLPDSVLTRIRSSCINEARFAEDATDQLEKIAIELSIQAFWLEKWMTRSPISTKKIVSSTPTVTPPPTSGKTSLPPVNPALVNSLIIGSSVILLLALVIFLKQFISTRRDLRKQPILFPGLPKQERLGGHFSGGAFVGISFDLESNNRL